MKLNQFTCNYFTDWANSAGNQEHQMQQTSSRPEVFCKKDVTKNFTQFTGKHLCRSLSEACNFIKKSLQHRCFYVHFAKFLTHLFYRTPPREFFWKDNFHGNFYVALEKVVWKLILTKLTTYLISCQLSDLRTGQKKL